MNLYYLSQTVSTGYDTYDSCVVAAESENEARLMRPDGTTDWSENEVFFEDWTKNPEDVEVTFIGVASKNIRESQVICASYNAG